MNSFPRKIKTKTIDQKQKITYENVKFQSKSQKKLILTTFTRFRY